MKHFIDCEFLEGPQKEKFPISLFRKETPNTIDLISIGIIAEDGREYYAISKDFNLKDAWNRWQQRTGEGDRNNIEPRLYWLRDNVLKPIFYELYSRSEKDGFIYNRWHIFNKGFSFKSLKTLINHYGKTNKQIAKEIISFTTQAKFQDNPNGKYLLGSDLSDEEFKKDLVWDNPEFYAYYADYDWVVFCWLFGKMMDLPKGFPKYCKDLKQEVDRNSYKDTHGTYHGKDIKNHPNFPKQTNEHNALADARWNKQLYEFLNNL